MSVSPCRLRFKFDDASCVPYSEAEATHMARGALCIADIGVASATAAALRVPT